jgi:hypothetical protein
MTQYASTLADVAGFAADPVEPARDSPRTSARLVLIDAGELLWHRARYRDCICAPADPVLVGPTTLQHWLWQRLQASPKWQAGSVVDEG